MESIKLILEFKQIKMQANLTKIFLIYFVNKILKKVITGRDGAFTSIDALDCIIQNSFKLCHFEK